MPIRQIRFLAPLLLAIAFTAPAQDSSQTARSRSDTLAVEPDSSLIFRTPPYWGTLSGRSLQSADIAADSLRWLSQRGLGEALAATGAFGIRVPSAAGGYAQLHLRGLDQRGIGFFLDGRPLGDPSTGGVNPDHLQPEDAARFEVVNGPRAFLYGLEHSTAAVNIVTREWNANKPYTRLVYGESGDAYSYSDGTFAQNVSRRISVTAGFQHLSAGGKDVRSPHEQWTVRGRVRGHLGNGWIGSFAERYATTQTDLNGGFDPARTPASGAFDPKLAAVVNGDSYEKIDRHDLDLSLVRLATGDSTATTRLSLYHTDILRLYRDEENRASRNGIFISSDHHLRRSGVQGIQELIAGPMSLAVSAGAENLRSGGSPNGGTFSIWRAFLRTSAEVELAPGLRAGIFGRLERFRSRTGRGLGTDASLDLSPSVQVFGGLSLSERLPGMFEGEWSDSTIIRPAPIGRERHLHVEAGIAYRPSARFTLRTVLFHRIVDDPIEMTTEAGPSPFGRLRIAHGPRLVCSGIEMGGSLHFWYILLEGNGTYQTVSRDGVGWNRFPRLTARGGLYCRGEFFDGSLNIRGGVRGTYASASIGDSFNPEFLAWGTPGMGELPGWSSVDAVISARIGDAQIQIVWENLTSIGAYTARYELLRPRGIRLGLAWEFVN